MVSLCRYAAKLPGEGADMYDAAEALRDAMLALGLACDGGKDSVSMVARAGDEVRQSLASRPAWWAWSSASLGTSVKCGFLGSQRP